MNQWFYTFFCFQCMPSLKFTLCGREDLGMAIWDFSLRLACTHGPNSYQNRIASYGGYTQTQFETHIHALNGLLVKTLFSLKRNLKNKK